MANLQDLIPTGTEGFDPKVRVIFKQWQGAIEKNMDQVATLLAQVTALETGTFFQGVDEPVIPGSAIHSISMKKIDIAGTFSPGVTAVWYPASGWVLEPIAGVVGGDTFMAKYTESASPVFIKDLVATQLDLDNAAPDKLVDAAGVKKMIDQARLPPGTVFPWIGGYFSDGNNGGFKNVLGNNADAVNARYGSQGIRVCDGAKHYDEDSPIYGGDNRYLPNITDSRYIRGAGAAGGTGGSNLMPHYHKLNPPGVRTAGTVLTLSHLPRIEVPYLKTTKGNSSVPDGTGFQMYINAQNSVAVIGGGGHAHDHYLDLPTMDTGQPTNTNNEPQYVNAIYLTITK